MMAESFTKLKVIEYVRVLYNFVKMIFQKREGFADQDPQLSFQMVKYIIGELYGCDFGFSEKYDKDTKNFVIFSLERNMKNVTIDSMVPEYLTRNILNVVDLGKSKGIKGSYFDRTILPPKNISAVTTFSALAYVLLTMAEYNNIIKIFSQDIKYAMNIVLLSDEVSNEVDTDPEISVGNGFDILENNYGLEFSEEEKSTLRKCVFHIMSYCMEENIESQLQRQRVCMFASKIP